MLGFDAFPSLYTCDAFPSLYTCDAFSSLYTCDAFPSLYTCLKFLMDLNLPMMTWFVERCHVESYEFLVSEVDKKLL